MADHFIKYCTECNKIMTQCRCMACDKTVLFGVCDECKQKQNEASNSNPNIDI